MDLIYPSYHDGRYPLFIHMGGHTSSKGLSDTRYWISSYSLPMCGM